jgi:hypothetical protein
MNNFKIFTLACAVIILFFASICKAQEVAKEGDAIPNALQTGKWRIGIRGGYSFQTGSTDEQEKSLSEMGFEEGDADDFCEHIKRGYKLSGQVHYLFWDDMGLGIDYDFFHTSGSISAYIDSPDLFAYTVFAKLKDDIFINYVGASFFSKTYLEQSNFFGISLHGFITLERSEGMLNSS